MEKLEDQLDILDPPYQTNQELNIGRVLDQYGIPFFYKQPTVVMDPQTKQNEIWKPSFTLPQYGCSVIDYIANSQDQDRIIQTYEKAVEKKGKFSVEDAVMVEYRLDKKYRKKDVEVRAESSKDGNKKE